MGDVYCLHLTQHDVDVYKPLIEDGYKSTALTAYIYSWQRETVSDKSTYPTLEQLKEHINKSKQQIKNVTKALKELSKIGKPVAFEETSSGQKNHIFISTKGYRKEDPQKNPTTAYVFTENAEAYAYTNQIDLEYDKDIFPYRKAPKINVSDVNGTNQAGIRTDSKGVITPNAFGIVVKKYQQDVNGKFVAKEGQFQDTDEDFKLFKSLNRDMFARLEQSGLTNVIFPSQMALGKSALPKRFAEWLQKELNIRFGIVSTIKENNTSGYEGYGLTIDSILDNNKNIEQPIYSDETVAKLYNLGVRAESKDPVERRENYVKSVSDPQTRIDRSQLINDEFMKLLNRELHLATINGTSLSYKEALDKLSGGNVKSVFDRIKNKFLSYVINEDFEKQSLIQAFVRNGLTEEQAIDRANKVYTLTSSKYVDVLNNWSAICDDACNIIYNATRIRIRLADNNANIAQQDTVDDDILPEVYDRTDDDDRVSTKDNIYNSYNEVSHEDTLSDEVRMLLSNLNSVIVLGNGKTKLDRDDLGRIRKVDMGDVHAVLINLLRNCIDAEDIIPTLKKNAHKYPWINQLLDAFTYNDNMSDAEKNVVDSIFTAFAVNMIGAWVGYIHESISNFDDNLKIKTSTINHAEDYSYWIDRWEKNINGNMELTSVPPFTIKNSEDKDVVIESVYDASGKYYIDRIDAVLAARNIALDAYRGTRETYNATSKEELEFSKNNIVDKDGNMLPHTKALYECLRAIGIDISEASFINAVQDAYFEQVEKDGKQVERAHEPFIGIANSVKDILEALKKDLKASKNSEADLNSIGKTGFYRISRYFISEAGDLAEMSLRENGKTRYAHIKDNFILRFLKQVKDLNKDKPVPEAFRDKYDTYFDYFIGEQYQKYPFFYRNGEFGIHVLELLKNNPEFREKFDINVVLTQGKKEISDLSDYEMLLSMFAEFNFEVGQKKSKEEEKAAAERGYTYARYYLPLPAEAGAGYVMTLPRYNSTDEIATRFTKILEQEVNRIMDVLHRDRLFRMGQLDPAVNMQDNFDIVRNEDGSIKSYGGAEFKFLVGLNNKVDVYINGSDIVRITDENKNEYDSTAVIALPEVVVELLEGNIDSYDSLAKTHIKPYLESEFSKFLQYQSSLGIDRISKKGMNIALGVESSQKENTKYIIYAMNALNKIRTLTENNYMYDGSFEDATLLRNIFESLIEIVNSTTNTDYRTTMSYNNYVNSTQSIPNLISAINILLYNNLKDVINYNSQKENPYSEAENMNYYGINPAFTNSVSNVIEQLSIITDKFDVNFAERFGQDSVELSTLREFFYNWSYAQAEMIELITGDLAQYKNFKEWIKRAKEYHANGDRLNVKAKWNGELVSDGYERMIITKDWKMVSPTLNEISAILDKHITNPIEKKFALGEFRKIVGTDAQTLRTLPSYRKIAIMHHDWDEKKEASYNRIVNNTWNFEDFQTVLEAIKPYVFTHIMDSWKDENGNVHIQKRSLQIKTAESVMLTMYAAIAGAGNNSKQIANLNRFMVNNNIDIMCFESAIKVGGKSKIDISNLPKDYNEAEKYLSSVINSDTIQLIDLNDMVIQHPIPEHFEDATQLIGTQFKKLILADTNPDTKIYVQGFTDKVIIMGEEVDCTDGITFKDAIRLYQELMTDQMLDSYQDVCGQFKTVEDLATALQEHIRNSATYSSDLLNAVQLITDPSTGKKVFNIPIHDNILKNKVENVLHAICKHRIIQQTIAGGTCTQISSFAYSDELKIVFKDGQNRILKKKSDFKTEEEYNQYIKDNIAAIAYVECYAPCFNSKLKDYLQQFTTNDGILDINNIPAEYRDEVCKCLGYRIPTEDKYSMIPLKIIGFLPSTLSSSIMLPIDWVAISGSDFDADKLYMMVRELEEDNEVPTEWIKWMLKNDAELQENVREESVSEIAKRINEDNNIKSKYKQLLDIWNHRPHSMKPIEYNPHKASNQQSKDNVRTRKARNNMIVSLCDGILTNPDIAANILNPGNFNEQKKAAVLSNIGEEIGTTRLKELGYSYEDLDKMSLKELEGIYEQYAPQEHPLNVTTWIKNHSRISSSGKLIGVFASLSATHPYFQLANIGIAKDSQYVLNGNKNQSFATIYSDTGTTISKLMSSTVNSSVDDVKYPTLADCNINMFTAAMVNVMGMKGDRIKDIAIFLHQPIIKEMCKVYFGTDSLAGNKRLAIDTAISEYSDIIHSIDASFNLNTFAKTSFDRNVFNMAQLFEDVSTDNKDLDYYKRQLNIGLLFKTIFTISNDVAELNKIFRVDTRNGGAGPTTADTMRLIANARKVLKDASEKKSYSLTNVNNIIKLDLIGSKNAEELRTSILNSKIPMVQAAFTLGVEVIPHLFKDYLPYLSEVYHDPKTGIVSKLNALTKTGMISTKLENRVYLESMLYLLTGMVDENGLSVFDIFTDAQGRTFKVGDMYNGKVLTSADMIGMWLYQMPNLVQAMKKNSEVQRNPFLKRFFKDSKKSSNAKAKTVPVVKFRSIGNNDITKQKIINFWESSINSNNPIVANYSRQIFFYAGLTNAFNFGPNSWIQLASSVLKKSIDSRYIDTLRSMLNGFELGEEFYSMFVRNHLHEREIAPLLNVKDFDVKEKDGKLFKDSFTVSLSSINTGTQKQILIKDGEEPMLHKYIAFSQPETDNEVYYELQDDGYTYQRIYPLGARNRVYVYNKAHGAPVSMEQLVNATSFKPTSLYYRMKADNTTWSEKIVEYTRALTREDARKDSNTLFLTFEGNATLEDLPNENSINLLVYPNAQSSGISMIKYHLKEIMKVWNTGKYNRIAIPSLDVLKQSRLWSTLSEESQVFLQQKLNGLSDWIDGLTKTAVDETDDRRDEDSKEVDSNLSRINQFAAFAKQALVKTYNLNPAPNDQNLCAK